MVGHCISSVKSRRLIVETRTNESLRLVNSLLQETRSNRGESQLLVSVLLRFQVSQQWVPLVGFDVPLDLLSDRLRVDIVLDNCG